MKSDKGQSLVLIGIALLVVSGVFLYLSISQPKISAQDAKSDVDTTIVVVGTTAQSSQLEQNVTTSEEYSTSYKVNINTATVNELAAVEGIGDTRAAAIVEYRQYLGSYTSVEQINDISGIGESTYEKISEYLTV